MDSKTLPDPNALPTLAHSPTVWPSPCQMNTEPDRYALWKQLTDLWAQTGPEGPRTMRSLAEHFGVPNQNVSQWKTGSGEKSAAPWFLIMKLALELNVLVVLDPHDGARLHSRAA